MGKSCLIIHFFKGYMLVGNSTHIGKILLDFAVENKPVEYYMTLGNKGEIKNEGKIVPLYSLNYFKYISGKRLKKLDRK